MGTRADQHGERIDQAEPGIVARPQVLAPVPAEALRHEIGLLQANLERRAEAGDAERGREQDEAPEAEHRDQHQRKLMVVIHVLDAAGRKDESGDDKDAHGDRAAEAHPEPGDGTVGSEIALVPFILDGARRVEQE